jgi:hypothetical protein
MDKGIRNSGTVPGVHVRGHRHQAEGHHHDQDQNDMTGPFSARLHRLSRSVHLPRRGKTSRPVILEQCSTGDAAIVTVGQIKVLMVTTERPQSTSNKLRLILGAMQHRMLADQTVTTENL